MLFEGWSKEAFDSAISRSRACIGDNHQPHPALATELAVVRIFMSAFLTEYHDLPIPYWAYQKVKKRMLYKWLRQPVAKLQQLDL
jgi:hypothetical protein